MSYGLISKHRAKIMGAAMLIIVFFHSTIKVDGIFWGGG